MNKDTNINNDTPPFFKSWRSIYFIVLINLGLLILLFHLFTQFFK